MSLNVETTAVKKRNAKEKEEGEGRSARTFLSHLLCLSLSPFRRSPLPQSNSDEDEIGKETHALLEEVRKRRGKKGQKSEAEENHHRDSCVANSESEGDGRWQAHQSLSRSIPVLQSEVLVWLNERKKRVQSQLELFFYPREANLGTHLVYTTVG